VDRRPLDVGSEHSVRSTLRMAHIVTEARPFSAHFTLTGHDGPLYVVTKAGLGLRTKWRGDLAGTLTHNCEE
jgi:hypothetical protein